MVLERHSEHTSIETVSCPAASRLHIMTLPEVDTWVGSRMNWQLISILELSGSGANEVLDRPRTPIKL